MNKKIEAIRQVVADYMQSEGCSCCRDEDAHRDHTKALALLLGVPMYEDGSGYNFSMFRTDRQPTTRAADATKKNRTANASRWADPLPARKVENGYKRTTKK